MQITAFDKVMNFALYSLLNTFWLFLTFHISIISMKLKQAGFFVIGIVLILLVINNFGLAETVSAIEHANLGWLLVAVLLQFCFIGFFILRLKVLVNDKGYISLPHMFRISMSGMFVSMVTPLAKLGGEPLKMYMLQGNVGNHNASASVAIESLVELFSSLLVIFAVAALLFGSIPPAFTTTLLIFLVVVGFAMGLLLKIFLTPHWLRKLVSWLATRMAHMLEAEPKEYADMFSEAFYEMIRSKKRVWGAFILSIGMKILEMARLWAVFLALGVLLPFQYVVIIWAIILVLMFIPWLPGSLGLVEFGGISVIISFGVTSPIAASSLVLDRLMSFWLPLVIGLFAFSAAKKRGELPKISLRKKEKHTKNSNE